jgi:hypothetical protein
MSRRNLNKLSVQAPRQRKPSLPQHQMDLVARELFQELRGRGLAPQQVQRIALALLCVTETGPDRSQ